MTAGNTEPEAIDKGTGKGAGVKPKDTKRALRADERGGSGSRGAAPAEGGDESGMNGNGGGPQVLFDEFTFTDGTRQATHVDVELYYVVYSYHPANRPNWRAKRRSVGMSLDLDNGRASATSDKLVDPDGKRLANVTEVHFAARRFSTALASPGCVRAQGSLSLGSVEGRLEGSRVLSNRVVGVGHKQGAEGAPVAQAFQTKAAVRDAAPEMGIRAAAGKAAPEIGINEAGRKAGAARPQISFQDSDFQISFQNFEYVDETQTVRKLRVHFHHKTPGVANPYPKEVTGTFPSLKAILGQNDPDLMDVYELSFEPFDQQNKPVGLPAVCSLKSTDGTFFVSLKGATSNDNRNKFTSVQEKEA